MKTFSLLFSFGVLLTFAACNPYYESNCEGVTEGHTCCGCCGTDCKEKHAHDVAGDFDFAMHSVCQASCGVSDYDVDDVVAIVDAKVGDITMCPVSGAIYKVKKESPNLEHNGESFHSCCAGCAKKFEEDPDRFYKNV